MNVSDLLDRAAEKWGSKPAIHDVFGTLSFAGLRDHVRRLAVELAARGVMQPLGIGLKAGNHRKSLVGFFAGLNRGAAVLLIPNRMKASEIQEIIDSCGLHFLLDETGDSELRLTRTNIDSAREFASHIAGPAIVRFSSGTTGAAKGVVLSHRSAAERLASVNRTLELGFDDTVLMVLPMAYHFFGSILPCVSCGATIAVAANDLYSASVLDCANHYRATILYASPLHIRLLARDTSGVAISTIRRVISTGSGISAETCGQFARRYARSVCQVWGSAELGWPIVNFRQAEQHPEAVGYAVDGYSVDVLDQDLREVPSGNVGQLAIKGPGMFDGYVSPPLTRDDVLRNGWFLTGDLASRDEGGLITIKGREKSVINVAGEKVFPEEVETVLLQHPAVTRCRVFGREHPVLGECVAAQVELIEEAPIQTGELSAWCRKHLSAYKVPRVVELVDEIPLTVSGKVTRRPSE
jgi:long-chain acyl-CoA synthetase